MEATINLLPKQTDAWNIFEDPLVNELGYGGAAGGGKTRLGWYLAIYIAEKYPTSRGAVGRKELKTLRITTLAELFVIFNEIGYVKDRDYSFDAKDNIINFANGSQILLLDTAYSPQDPEYTRFGSLALTWAWVEESNESPEKAIAILKTRIGRHNKFNIDGKDIEVKPFWLETFNPNKGHVYRTYYKPYKDGNLPEYRRFIPALPKDNPLLPKSYIENLSRADEVTKQRLLYGNFDYSDDPKKIFNYVAITDLVSNVLDDPFPKQYLVNDIARFGGDRIVLAHFKGFVLSGFGIYTYQGTDETSKKIKDKAKTLNIPIANILSDEDGVGGGVVDNIPGSKGFMGNSRALEITDTFTGKNVAENFVNLRSQCYFKLAEFVNEHKFAIKLEWFETNIEGLTKEMVVSDLFEELDAVKRIESTMQNQKMAIISKQEIKEEIGRSPDIADVCMMRMLFELREPKKVDLPPIPRLNVNKTKTNPAE